MNQFQSNPGAEERKEKIVRLSAGADEVIKRASDVVSF